MRDQEDVTSLHGMAKLLLLLDDQIVTSCRLIVVTVTLDFQCRVTVTVTLDTRKVKEKVKKISLRDAMLALRLLTANYSRALIG